VAGAGRDDCLAPAVGGAPGPTLLYAISDEVHQGGVIGRHMSAVDVGIDVTIVVAGSARAARAGSLGLNLRGSRGIAGNRPIG